MQYDGKRVRRLRMGKGLNMRDLAQEAGLAESTLYRIETGKVRPTPGTMLSIARVLGVSLDSLINEELSA